MRLRLAWIQQPSPQLLSSYRPSTREPVRPLRYRSESRKQHYRALGEPMTRYTGLRGKLQFPRCHKYRASGEEHSQRHARVSATTISIVTSCAPHHTGKLTQRSVPPALPLSRRCVPSIPLSSGTFVRPSEVFVHGLGRDILLFSPNQGSKSFRPRVVF